MLRLGLIGSIAPVAVAVPSRTLSRHGLKMGRSAHTAGAVHLSKKDPCSRGPNRGSRCPRASRSGEGRGRRGLRDRRRSRRPGGDGRDRGRRRGVGVPPLDAAPRHRARQRAHLRWCRQRGDGRGPSPPGPVGRGPVGARPHPPGATSLTSPGPSDGAARRTAAAGRADRDRRRVWAHDVLVPEAPMPRCGCPTARPLEAALARTTDLGIVAHQDDLEFMALAPIGACLGDPDRWFTGVACTDGAGSARTGRTPASPTTRWPSVRARAAGGGRDRRLRRDRPARPSEPGDPRRGGRRGRPARRRAGRDPAGHPAGERLHPQPGRQAHDPPRGRRWPRSRPSARCRSTSDRGRSSASRDGATSTGCPTTRRCCST